MGNGHGPPILKDADYQTIKAGSCITGGPYDGCIKVLLAHYWVENGGELWELHTGEPTADQVKITDDVWDKCKDGGDLDWSTRGEYWYDSQDKHYRWDGQAGEEVELVEI